MLDHPSLSDPGQISPTRPRPWLIIFDLDGTLIDSSLDLCLAVNAAMEHVGAPQHPHELITQFIGDGAAMLIRRALGDPGDLDSSLSHRDEQQGRFEQAFRFFLAFYREHKLDNTRLYNGVAPALDAIRRRFNDVPMAVLTNKPVRPSREICDALGVSPFLFANFGGDSFETKKPDPQGLLQIMSDAMAIWNERGVEAASLLPSGVLMVGDSEVDILTARRAGARSLGCRYGLSPHSLALAKPDAVCDSASEWPEAIMHLFEQPA